MVYIVLSVLVTAFIYINVLGMWKGIGEIPEGQYKDTLWKYKKMEIVEKGVISLIFIAITFSMKLTDEVAMVALAAGALLMIIEGFFGKYIRKSLVCPSCGEPIWTGNFIVLLKPRKKCAHCGYAFVEEPESQEIPSEETEENDTEQ